MQNFPACNEIIGIVQPQLRPPDRSVFNQKTVFLSSQPKLITCGYAEELSL